MPWFAVIILYKKCILIKNDMFALAIRACNSFSEGAINLCFPPNFSQAFLTRWISLDQRTTFINSEWQKQSKCFTTSLTLLNNWFFMLCRQLMIWAMNGTGWALPKWRQTLLSRMRLIMPPRCQLAVFHRHFLPSAGAEAIAVIATYANIQLPMQPMMARFFGPHRMPCDSTGWYFSQGNLLLLWIFRGNLSLFVARLLMFYYCSVLTSLSLSVDFFPATFHPSFL